MEIASRGLSSRSWTDHSDKQLIFTIATLPTGVQRRSLHSTPILMERKLQRLIGDRAASTIATAILERPGKRRDIVTRAAKQPLNWWANFIYQFHWRACLITEKVRSRNCGCSNEKCVAKYTTCSALNESRQIAEYKLRINAIGGDASKRCRSGNSTICMMCHFRLSTEAEHQNPQLRDRQQHGPPHQRDERAAPVLEELRMEMPLLHVRSGRSAIRPEMAGGELHARLLDAASSTSRRRLRAGLMTP